MASAPQFIFSPLLSLSKTHPPHKSPFNFLPPSLITPRKSSTRVQSGGIELGDFGARDPFDAEIESNFGDKVLGFQSTEHKILIPNALALSLAEQNFIPNSQLQHPMSVDEAKQLLFKVVGWRIVEEEGGLKLHGMWKVRDLKCGEELINRINGAVESTGYIIPTLHLDPPNQVRAELWTSSIGGLSINDFIVAAKIDKIKLSDLQPRQRVWA
ncbi:hypothetical protein ABFS83_06G055000 [Erythranthe nasuta]